MTDISKEAVALDLIWLDQLAAEDGVSPAVMLAERYRALSARVEELEQQVRDTLKISNLKREQGRLQGLDEAMAACEDCYITPDNDREEGQHDGVASCVEAIQTLKEQSND